MGALVMIAGLPAQAAPALSPGPGGSGGTRTGCFPQTYQGKLRVVTYHRGPFIAHSSGIVIGPSGSHTVTRTAAFEDKVTAGAQFNAGGSGEVGTVFAKVNAHFDVTVKSEGSHTRSGSVSVTDVVSNPTRRNKKFIAFDGVTVYSGRYYLTTCGADQRVHRKHGHYVTFNNITAGIARCGAGGAGSAITRLALQRCSA
jgi:hypothetical protein